MTKDAELWRRKYNAAFKLMQELADAGRDLIDQYECATNPDEVDPPWITVLKRMDPDDLEFALRKLAQHTQEVDSRYGDPDPEGTNHEEGEED